jgi:hypothetical protein
MDVITRPLRQAETTHAFHGGAGEPGRRRRACGEKRKETGAYRRGGEGAARRGARRALIRPQVGARAEVAAAGHRQGGVGCLELTATAAARLLECQLGLGFGLDLHSLHNLHRSLQTLGLAGAAWTELDKT